MSLVRVNAGDAAVGFPRLDLPGSAWRRDLASDRDGWRGDSASAVGFLASPELGVQRVEVWARDETR